MDFERYVSNYSDTVAGAVRLPACGGDFFLAAKGIELLKLLDAHFGKASRPRILDLGCGIGLLESQLAGAASLLVGVDVAIEAVHHARQSVLQASFAGFDGLHLPFSECAFDVAVAVCVFHHVDASRQPAILKEMARVVRPGGLVVIFEHNPWNPATRIVVSRCELDQDAKLLSAPTATALLRGAQLQNPQRRFLFFFPWPGRLWRTIEDYLGWLPLGAQYMTSAIRPK
jgi:Methylase involved in ubiquinone/menaquinone biosynthesis